MKRKEAGQSRVTQQSTNQESEMSLRGQKAAADHTTTTGKSGGVSLYKIVDDIPVPVARMRGAAARFPFADMKPGQAIIVTMEQEGVDKIDALKGRVRSAIYTFSKRGTGAKFIHAVNDDGKGITIWRRPEAA
jgi:hypothetical protein